MTTQLKKQILTLVKKDQTMRKSGKWDAKVDKENAGNLKAIIKEHGWPDINLIGKEASRGAWLICQHADHDVKFQKLCLKLMEKKLKENRIEPQYLAYLTDRVLVNQGKLQLYGTQFYLKNNKLVPRPIRDKKNLEERRKLLKLEPFIEYKMSLIKRQKKL